MDQPAIRHIIDSSVASDVDAAIMRAAKKSWQKVAMIVAKVITVEPYRQLRLQDLGVAERVKLLVADGRLEAQGNLDRMRYSEVRLPLK